MSASVSNPKHNPTVLVVDGDNRSQKRLAKLTTTFEEAGYRVLYAEDAAVALKLLRDERCDLVVVDLEQLSGDGLGLCRLHARPAEHQPRAAPGDGQERARS